MTELGVSMTKQTVIFFQPHNFYYLTCGKFIMSTLMAIMDTVEDMYSL